MQKLNNLIARCKGGVHLTVNEHRDFYQSVDEWLIDRQFDKDVLKIMVEKDTSIRLQFFPNTPITSYTIIHHDLEAAIDEALDLFEG